MCPILAKITFTVQEPDSVLHPSWIRTGLAAQVPGARARVSGVARKARVRASQASLPG